VTGFQSFVDAASRYYTDKFRLHGATAAGVDWRDRDSQHLRFEQLLKIAGGRRSFSLNDYGCGYGALAEWLLERDCDVRYCGLDVSRPLIEHARRSFGRRPEVTFVDDTRALPVADYTVASGVFNVKLDAPAHEWTDYVVETIHAMRSRSSLGLAFNMLTSYSDPDRTRPDLYYGDPAFFFDLCKRQLSREVALLHDYALWEFTVLVRLEDEQ
jgi:SAM-dependent methyltransferase